MATTTTVVHHLTGKRFVGITPDEMRVVIDMEQEHKAAMGPMQLALNALAACAAADVVGMIHKRRLTIRSYRIEASGERFEGTPRYFTGLHTRHVLDVPGLDRPTAERFVELAVTKYCSVASSMKAPSTFEVVLAIEEGAAAAGGASEAAAGAAEAAGGASER